MTRFVQVGEVRIAYEQEGRGPPLMLMHGAEASRQMFDALIPLLSGHFTVIAYDQRDCGATEGPATTATLEDLAKDAKRLIEALGYERVHVFGSSFGGRLAQALALLHPCRVDHLVLGSTWPLHMPYDDLGPDALHLVALRRGLPATAAELATWFFTEDFLQQRPDLRQVFTAAKPQTARSARRSVTVNSTLERRLADIQAPTLLLAGEFDRVVPPQVTLAMASSIPGARTALLAGTGHATAIQVPQRLAWQITDFVQGRTKAQGVVT